MRLIKHSIFIFVSIISFNLFADTGLTEQSLNKMFNSMKKAVKLHDADSLMSHFSDDATITLEMPKNMGGTIVMGVTEYKQILQQGWAMPAKFTYEVRDLIFNIAPDKKTAVATDLTIETVEVGGKVIMSSKTKEKVQIKYFSGYPLITSLYGKVEL